jgi:thymidine kinase
MKQLRLIIGGMKSGKSEELARRMRRLDIAKREYFLFLPNVERRDRDLLFHRSAYCKQYTIALDNDERWPNEDISGKHGNIEIPVFVDEAQFFKSLKFLLNFEDVTIAALNGTAEQKMWPSVAEIIPYATEIILLKSVCDYCGGEATLSFYPGGKDEDVLIGDDNYKAICRDCLEKEMKK